MFLALFVAVLFFGGTTASAASKNLRKGSRGDAVKEVQSALHVFPTGFFGRDTDAFVRKFQKENGLKPDGIVGPKTYTALFLTGKAKVVKAKEAAPTQKEIAKANSEIPRPRVLDLQEGLGHLGFKTLLTGRLDLLTMTSYTSWQAAAWWFENRGEKGIVTEKQIVQVEKQAAKKIAKEQKTLLEIKGCIATKFGHKDKEDCGRGTPLLDPRGPKCGGIVTRGENHKAVAIPISFATKLWNIKVRYTKKGRPIYVWKEFRGTRTAGVYVRPCATEKWHGPYPIDDFGPGKGQQRKGVLLDVCNGVQKDIRGDGWDRVDYRVVENVFPERAG